MPHFEKHSKGMQALIDTSEAMLNAMETNGIDQNLRYWYIFLKVS